MTIFPEETMSEKEVELYINNEFLLSAKVSKKNLFKISRKSEQGKLLYVAINSGKKIELRG